MKEKRDDFSWLVAFLEEPKRDQNVRPRHMYTHYKEQTAEYQQWKRREKRKELKWIIYLLIFALSIILPLIFH